MGSIPDEKVLDKIKKLLALANSSNEHEASLAAQRAQKLLLKYNLTMQSVEKHDSDYVNRVVEERTFLRTEDKFVSRILTDHFFVRVFSQRLRTEGYEIGKQNSFAQVVLLGTKSNVEIASYIRDFLINEFHSCWISYRRESGCPASYQQSYYYGLLRGLDEKLKAQKKEVEQEMGLIWVSDPKLDQILADMEVRSKKTKLDFQSQAVADGESDGQNIKIRKALKNNSTRSGKYLK